MGGADPLRSPPRKAVSRPPRIGLAIASFQEDNAFGLAPEAQGLLGKYTLERLGGVNVVAPRRWSSLGLPSPLSLVRTASGANPKALSSWKLAIASPPIGLWPRPKFLETQGGGPWHP